MQNPYRIFTRRGVFYIEDTKTGRQTSLKTRNKREAEQLCLVRNQSAMHPQLNLALAKAYISGSDPEMLKRTWVSVFELYGTRGRNTSCERTARAAASKPFDMIRDKALLDTTAADLLAVLGAGGSSTNNYLRRFQNLALDLGWLLTPILPKKAFPRIRKGKDKRAITREEFEAIREHEQNQERRKYYELLWEVGAAQTDGATLKAEDINWNTMVLCYQRIKLDGDREPCRLAIGSGLATLLQSLPKTGPLFPKIAKRDPKHRASEFCRICKLLGIKGISLHSFRYAWAERAAELGYPERFAQSALGHSSRAVHRAYARHAKVICPPLEDYSAASARIVPFQTAANM